MALVQAQNSDGTQPDVTVYVSQHCEICGYTYEVVEFIRTHFPQVEIRLVDIATAAEDIPDVIFATPTYVLNGKVWSLGNPSHEKVRKDLNTLCRIYKG